MTSKITDQDQHKNIIIIKKFEILWGLAKCNRDTKWVDAVGKMALIGLFHRIATSFRFVKSAISVKCKIKQITIKWCMPILLVFWKVKHIVKMWSNHATLSYFCKRNESIYPCKYLYVSVHSTFAYNSKKVKAGSNPKFCYYVNE